MKTSSVDTRHFTVQVASLKYLSKFQSNLRQFIGIWRNYILYIRNIFQIFNHTFQNIRNLKECSTLYRWSWLTKNSCKISIKSLKTHRKFKSITCGHSTPYIPSYFSETSFKISNISVVWRHYLWVFHTLQLQAVSPKQCHKSVIHFIILKWNT